VRGNLTSVSTEKGKQKIKREKIEVLLKEKMGIDTSKYTYSLLRYEEINSPPTFNNTFDTGTKIFIG
jgi:hypothetical protein